MVLIIMVYIQSFQTWLILAVLVILLLVVPLFYFTTLGVDQYVSEREDAQNRWVYFIKQALTVLPTARLYGNEPLFLERLECVNLGRESGA